METEMIRQTEDLEMANNIATAVAEAGGRAYFVGGFVRDRIMGKDNKDIDIEVHGITPETLGLILDRFGKRIVMGASFGVFGLEHYNIDIAMPRKEHATGRGHKDFEVFVDPYIGPEKACERRDFTINAMMQDVLTGEVLDYFGGRKDLERALIRHVNDESFSEDPLRVYRAAQFAARFEFTIDPDTKALCRGMDLSALTKERVMGETEKALLKADKPSIYFEELRAMDALKDRFPEIEALIGVEQNPIHHPEGDVWNHTMRVLDEAAKLRSEAKNPIGFMIASLCHDIGKTITTAVVNGRIHAYGHEYEGLPLVEQMLNRITNHVKLKAYVLNMVELHMQPNKNAECSSKKKTFMHMYDRSLCPEDLLLLAKADAIGCRGDADRLSSAEMYARKETILRGRLEEYYELTRKPQVMGRDLIEAGLKPGPEFSEALAYAHKLALSGIEKEEALRQTLGMMRKKQ